MRVFVIVFLILMSTSIKAQQQEQLIWSDEFDGTGSPNSLNWGFDLGAGGWGNNEIQTYTSVAYNVRQESGNLVIEAHKVGNAWTSARLISHNKFNFTYGKIEYRAKIPAGIGTWPALWMLGESLFTGAGWPGCGEVDVMEHVGKHQGYIHSSIHTTSSSGNTINTSNTFIYNATTQFHVYAANWTAEKIEFSIDGNIFYTYNPPVKNNATWPFYNPCFIIMNVAMGGNWGSDPQYETNGLKNGIDPALSVARMEIDYVRVYAPSSAIEEFPSNDGKTLSFMPNPSNGKIQIKIPAGKKIQGTIYNLTGADVFHFQASNDINTFDVSSLPKGMYFITLSAGSSTQTHKLILQ
ncbi:MAG: family 16 glycosylhydrolase [Bacteroidota bacterium]